MEIRDGLGLSPRKVTYLKYIAGCSGAVRTSELAVRFGVDPSTVTKTLGELADAGLLSLTPYHGAVLSQSGREYAGFLTKRHRILALALTHFGLSDEEACAEASRFESLVSKGAIDRMCRAMGHPQNGACGAITHDTGCLGAGTGSQDPVPGEPEQGGQP
ncbi:MULTISPECIES: metal-dependent transcriptional regulator [unclassified Methanoregula]|uniref:metal-dependent transcriptional regulator n=1 Tax=unclassified Methanoregula TaxID=2649730 RepID=UPI0009D37472|nr:MULTISPECIES: metal-dependent transcriptional regulator [unclassified Methanoregula]OPX64409.1 MAG: manganese transport regulator MntR [Methanoregula sp. PtaB.Bin085]OPY34921.1 MAG: manganese transport regulator MntR [Methanoregula sp. PtaU1.Bin006]